MENQKSRSAQERLADEMWADERAGAIRVRRWPTAALELFFRDVLNGQASSLAVFCLKGTALTDPRSPLVKSGLHRLLPAEDLTQFCEDMGEARHKDALQRFVDKARAGSGHELRGRGVALR